MSLVSATDRRSLERNGYLTLDGLVPEAICESAVESIDDFLENDRDEPATWYRAPDGVDQRSLRYGGVSCYHTKPLWRTRANEAVYQAFAELLDRAQLWVSIDGADFKPPRDDEHPGFDDTIPFHWQMEPTVLAAREQQREGTPAFPYGLNGILVLREATFDHGLVQVAPGVFRNLYDEVLDDPETVDRIDVDVADYETTELAAPQGSLILWDRRVPYGNGPNRATDPRYAQFVRMVPERFADTDRRTERVNDWRNRPDSPSLTPLGRKLLGADPWHGWLSS